MNQNIVNLHITEQEWYRFWQNELTPDEQTKLLSHVCDCDYCSARMADGIPETRQLTAPAHLAEETITYCRKHTRVLRFLHGYRFQFFTYSLKVGLAMVLALLLVVKGDFSIPADRPVSTPPASVTTFSLTTVLSEGSQYVCRKLNEFSMNIFDKEDYYDEK